MAYPEVATWEILVVLERLARRYERGSILLTSNQSPGAWGEVFGDTIIASAILDRLLHHATTIDIKGESYRLKEKTPDSAGSCCDASMQAKRVQHRGDQR